MRRVCGGNVAVTVEEIGVMPVYSCTSGEMPFSGAVLKTSDISVLVLYDFILLSCPQVGP